MYNLKIPGWMPESELKVIEKLARTVPENGKAVEIGSFVGRTSWCIAKTIPQSATLTCIDIWNPSEHPYTPPSSLSNSVGSDFGQAENVQQTSGTIENFLRNTKDCSNITAIQGRSPNDFQDWVGSNFDLIFLDGIHHNPVFVRDVHHWLQCVKPGGILCGDDCARTHPDVLWTIHDVAKDLNLVFAVEKRIWMLEIPPRRLLNLF